MGVRGSGSLPSPETFLTLNSPHQGGQELKERSGDWLKEDDQGDPTAPSHLPAPPLAKSGEGRGQVEAKFLERAMRVTAALSPDFRVLLFLLSFPQQTSPHQDPHLFISPGGKGGSGALEASRSAGLHSQVPSTQTTRRGAAPRVLSPGQPEGAVKVLLVPAGGCASTPGGSRGPQGGR